MQNILIQTNNNNGKFIIQITGAIDENFSQHTTEIPKNGEIEFSMQGLKSINSTGIREWIKLMQSMSKAHLCFSMCPKIFIDQVNMVSDFIPKNSKVLSFYVPYYNEDLDKEILLLYKHDEDFTANNIKIKDHCADDKGNQFELDVVKSKYFKFIQTV